jgi:hypothetical protein
MAEVMALLMVEEMDRAMGSSRVEVKESSMVVPMALAMEQS